MGEELFQEAIKTFMNGVPILYKTVGIVCLSTAMVASHYGNIAIKITSPLLAAFGVLSYGVGKEMEWENETAYKEML